MMDEDLEHVTHERLIELVNALRQACKNLTLSNNALSTRLAIAREEVDELTRRIVEYENNGTPNQSAKSVHIVNIEPGERVIVNGVWSS